MTEKECYKALYGDLLYCVPHYDIFNWIFSAEHKPDVIRLFRTKTPKIKALYYHNSACKPLNAGKGFQKVVDSFIHYLQTISR